MNPAIQSYNARQATNTADLCDLLARSIDDALPDAESRIWHAHPVWFLDGNPIVGSSPQKRGLRLMFWSGASFDEPGLSHVGEKFKDASVFLNDVAEVEPTTLQRWLQKARDIQWDYKNVVRRKGRLERLGSGGRRSGGRVSGL